MNKIGMLDSQVIRAALLALVGLAGLIASFFGVDEALFSEKAARLVDALLLVLTTGSVIWAAYARATKPTPPITDGAVAKTAELQKSQEGGFARTGALSAVLLMALSACALVGFPQPKTFNDRLAAGYATVTAVSEATQTWIAAKRSEAQRLPVASQAAFLVQVRKDAENIIAQAQRAKDGLDIARDLQGIDLKSAEARLASTIVLLETLQAYLEDR